MVKPLTEAEVKSRKDSGKINRGKVQTVSTFSIIRRHTFTLFNIINIVLAAICIIVGAPKNAIFVFIAIFNTLIAIVNDVRAKRIVEKLTLITEKHATVVRNIKGVEKEIEIENEDIVLDDILRYHLGDQIIVDSVVEDGFLEVNESFVTGESNTIRKNIGDKLISGSFVIAGNCLARATSVGEASFTNKLLKNAKKIKLDKSELFTTLGKLIKYISFALIPIGTLLYFSQKSVPDASSQTAIISTISVLLSMIPEGLMLLTSSVLALATIRLGRKKVLVQDLYSIETLARVDTICLDKTGTLTTGNLKVIDIIKKSKGADLENSIRTILGNLSDNNSTYDALVNKFGKNTEEKADKLIPFSSERKFSGVVLSDGTELRMGAYEFMTSDRNFIKEEQIYSRDYRVITVLKIKQEKESILGFILLADEIRKNASKLLAYFRENDVNVKIISGDNLGTIEKICSEVGMTKISSVDMSESSHKNYAELVKTKNIFARVTPEEKRNLIKAMEKQGHTVAMTGDGVNDVLALREANCGISIGAGADAAKRVSRLVLLDNDFDAVPEIIKEGRRTINNVTRSSTLFLSKTIYASILSLIFIFIGYTYPFTPLEMSIINFILIGAPSFILALEPNFNRVRTDFWQNIVRHSLPSALTVVSMVVSLVIVARYQNFTWAQIIAFSCLLTHFIGFLLLYKISRPLNRLRASLFAGLIAAVAFVYLVPFMREFYELEFVSVEHLGIFTIFIIAILILFIIYSCITAKILTKINNKK